MCDEYIQQYARGKLELQPGCDAEQSLEAQLTGELNRIRENAANVRGGRGCHGALRSSFAVHRWREVP